MKFFNIKKINTYKSNSIEGMLESSDNLFLTGWLYDKSNPNMPLEFVLISRGLTIFRGIADDYREDLYLAGIGDGHHGFSVPFPEEILDGSDYEVELRDAETGFRIKGSPINISGRKLLTEMINLDGNLITGSSFDNNSLSSDQGEIEVFENGDMIAVGKYWEDKGVPGKIDFAASIPHSAFDGRPHGFQIRIKSSLVSLASVAFIMPNALVAEDVLLKYARQAMRPSMSFLAGFRYQSLSESLQKVTNENTLGLPVIDFLKQLNYAHDFLAKSFNERDKKYSQLVFPKIDKPKVSIVIPAHNKFSVTYHCLLSLLLAPNKASFEVILIDDGSTDQTKNIPGLISGVSYLRNEQSLGFVRSCNKAATIARGQFIVMLNNDTEVTAHWLDELLVPIEHFHNVGLVGAKLLYPDGKLQDAGGIVWNNGDPWQYGNKQNALDARFNYTRQVDYLSGACILLPRALWEDLGGFNEIYAPAYFEDTDLAFAIRNLGYKTVYTPLSQVIHFEGISNGKNTSNGIKKWQEINHPKFKRRWSAVFKENGRMGVDIELAKDRNIEMRALVIDAETPMPDQNAGSYAAIQEIRILQSLGFKCTFIPSNMAWMGKYTEDLQRMGVEVIYSPFFGSVSELLQKRGSEFDLVYITRYYVAQQFLQVIRDFAPRAKVILMNADLHFLRELRAALNIDGQKDLTQVQETRTEELDVMASVDLVLVYTDIEKAVILSHNLDRTKVAICPWVVDIPKHTSKFKNRKDIVFLGGFNHKPNQEAVIWFAERVAPLLAKAHPNIKIKIYGSNISAELESILEKHVNIQVEGWVENINEVYDLCKIFISPLQSGAGLKGKVSQALAYGVPSILSPLSIEGFSISDGIEAFIATNPKDWVSKIEKVYFNESEWLKISQAAQELARRSFSMEKAINMMQEALSEVDLYLEPSAKNLIWK